MKKNITNLRASVAACTLIAAASAGWTPATAQDNADEDITFEEVVVTGSRIVRTELTATSPVTSINKAQLRLDRAQTIEDIQQKLPQSAAGANSTGAAVGDSLGSSTLDLRGLGQNRTLVLVNGTRAVPFSFRNAVDLNSIPTGLIKRVEVLTGGAAAIYGADAVAGVVNFIMDDEFDGMEASTSYEMPKGGAETLTVEGIFGGPIAGGRGHITGYVGYTERQELLAGERDFTANAPTLVASEGGNFTDVASGNFFAFDDAGNLVSDRQTTNVTPDRYLVYPMERISAGAFFKYELFEDVAELYGRAMYTEVKVTSAGATGQTPVVVNEQVTLTSDNPFLPAEAASLLTFDANGEALVNVERNLGLGLQYTETDRDTIQIVAGVRGDLTSNLSYDVYGQYGRTEGSSTVFNDGLKNNAGGTSRFADIANTVDIFGPGADLSSLSTPLEYVYREREQKVLAVNLSGDSAGMFELPAGPVRFAVGYEYRKETGIQRPGAAVADGQTYRLSAQGAIDASFTANEFYGELLVPLVTDVAFIQDLSLEGAYRTSDYSNTGKADTWKVGLSWAVTDDLRFRATRQTAIRAPNLGEFAGPEVGLALSLFDPESADLIPRLLGRYDGDPCIDGRGDAEQCARFGAGDLAGAAFDTSTALYTFGGNPDIMPETAVTYTVGAVITPEAIPGLSATIDYYNIEIDDAVSQIQPIAALTNCYIDNPVADNPLCGAVKRDPSTGLISQALVNDFNLASLKQAGLDVGVTYSIEAPGVGGDLRFAYQGNIVTSQSRQANATVESTDCKGTFGGSCSGDFASFVQADYRHRFTVDWANEKLNVQVGWRMIGGVTNVLDDTDTIPAQHYIDVGATYDINEMFQLTVGVDNLFDKQTPIPNSGGNHFGALSDYDLLGRTVGFSLRIRG